MSQTAPEPGRPDHAAEALAALARYPLLDALRLRRSRRFALGATLPAGGLKYTSKHPPHPLDATEEALLVFAAAGINGYCLADLPLDSGPEPESGGGNVMAALTGRTIASADAVHATTLFVINDEGTYMTRRPQDFAITEIDDLERLARAGRYAELWERGRIKIEEGRATIPREVPSVFPFNKWSTNRPGTTYFLPVCDLTAMYINVVLSAFDEQMGFYAVDERNTFKPAGVKRFAKSRGGTLHDDPDDGRVVPILGFEAIIIEFVLAEQAFMAHNLSLMEQAMGLGGWTHFATAADTAWLERLGFTMGSQRASQVLHAGFIKRTLMRLLGQDRPFPYAAGLTVDGTDLIKPYCPPYYPTMEAAVRAFLDTKRKAFFEAEVDGDAIGTWRDPRKVQASIPWFSDAAIEATIAYCTYIYETYGRFPAYFGPMRTTLAHQAHHLDLEFYDEHFGPNAYSETQARHFRDWH